MEELRYNISHYSRKLLEGFGPRLPGFDLVKRFSLKVEKISKRTCAILVEPILGEGGIVTLPVLFKRA